MASQCPNCGAQDSPQVIQREFADCSITFYNCPRCDFSTWDAREYSLPDERVTAKPRAATVRGRRVNERRM